MAILPYLAMFLMELKGLVYAIAMYFYAFRLAFSGILHCILPHFVLRFAAKRTAFSTKTHYILLQMAQKQVQRVVVLE
jgi:hypothetical protein